jgi:hypothetical protein
MPATRLNFCNKGAACFYSVRGNVEGRFVLDNDFYATLNIFADDLEWRLPLPSEPSLHFDLGAAPNIAETVNEGYDGQIRIRIADDALAPTWTVRSHVRVVETDEWLQGLRCFAVVSFLG